MWLSPDTNTNGDVSAFNIIAMLKEAVSESCLPFPNCRNLCYSLLPYFNGETVVASKILFSFSYISLLLLLWKSIVMSYLQSSSNSISPTKMMLSAGINVRLFLPFSKLYAR